MKIERKKLFIIMAVLAITILILFAVYFLYERQQKNKQTQPVELTAVKLIDKTCDNCFDADTILDVIKKEKVIFKNIRDVDINSDEGKQLIAKYSVIKVPLVIINGQLDNQTELKTSWNAYGKEINGTLVSNVYPPYKDLKTGTIEGLVDLTILYDETCKECYNTQKHLNLLEAEGINPVSINKFDVVDPEAQDLIKKYNIKKVPTIILSPEASHYKRFVDDWKNVGIVTQDDNYLFTSPEDMGTYKNIETGEIINK